MRDLNPNFTVAYGLHYWLSTTFYRAPVIFSILFFLMIFFFFSFFFWRNVHRKLHVNVCYFYFPKQHLYFGNVIIHTLHDDDACK